MPESCEDLTVESVIRECGSHLGYTMLKTGRIITNHNIVYSRQRYFCHSITATLFFCDCYPETSSTNLTMLFTSAHDKLWWCHQIISTHFANRILKYASPIDTAHLTRPLLPSEYKRKSGLALETSIGYHFTWDEVTGRWCSIPCM